MASIKKMGNKYYVYYYHPTIKKENGQKKQVYEDFDVEEQALARKAEIERKLKNGELNVPANMTVEDYFYIKYVPLYASSKWKYKTWDTNIAIWRGNILPFFGQMKIAKVTPSDIERFLNDMRKRKQKGWLNTPEEDVPFLSETTIRYFYVMLNCFFKKAVEWEDIEKSPVKCEKPKASTKPRKYWEPEQFEEALQNLDDELVHLAVHLAFRCTLRIGEVCALTWEDIMYDSRSVSITKTMQRVTLEALKTRQKSEVLHTYPQFKKGSGSKLILTPPKSEYGVRENVMSDQLIEEFRQRELKVTLDKARLGRKYQDHNLVFCFDDGRPVEPGRLSRRFKAWLTRNGLEDMGEFDEIDFHSIRISSTSLKLAASGGDIKSAQKDLGDKTPHMVLSTYSRSLKKQHKEMNEKFDEAFYGGGADMTGEKINDELLLQAVAEFLKRPGFLEKTLKAMEEDAKAAV